MHAPGRPNSDDPTRPADPRGERAAASLTDVRGEVPDFFQGLHGTIARALNCFRDRRDAFWEAKQYGRVELLDEETVLEKMVYVAANPVAAGLVDRGEKWPGIRLLPDASGRRVIRVEKPEFFFQQDEGLPEEVQVVIERPVHHDYPDNAEFAARLDEKIEAREKELRGAAVDAGRSFCGVVRVKAQDPFATPRTREPIGAPVPRFATRNKELLKQAEDEHGAWLAAYEDALARWCEDDREAVFPPGTWWMRVFHHANCESDPARAPP